MPYESNERLRRELLERLRNIGMSPDLANDQAAVDAICRETGANRAEVCGELARMRLERGQGVFRRMGLSAPPQAFLASVAATRHSLIQRDQSMRERFDKDYRARSSMTRGELIADMDGFDSAPAQRLPGSVARYERDIGRENMRAAP